MMESGQARVYDAAPDPLGSKRKSDAPESPVRDLQDFALRRVMPSGQAVFEEIRDCKVESRPAVWAGKQAVGLFHETGRPALWAMIFDLPAGRLLSVLHRVGLHRPWSSWCLLLGKLLESLTALVAVDRFGEVPGAAVRAALVLRPLFGRVAASRAEPGCWRDILSAMTALSENE